MTPLSAAALDALVARFEQPAFIADDPIAIPHGFDDPRDREVIGLYAALLAWGRRPTILAKMGELCARMQYQPYRFVRDFRMARDAPRLAGFKHRTFQPDDAFWLTRCVQAALHAWGSLEASFAAFMPGSSPHVGPAIDGFSRTLPTLVEGVPPRLQKHLARPSTGSAAKRLAMYLRWMVRPGPVDLGVWTALQPAQLVLPLDVHAGRQARAFGMLERAQNDWRAVEELTAACRRLAPHDPARYDFAFFGSGVYGISPEASFAAAKNGSATGAPTAR